MNQQNPKKRKLILAIYKKAGTRSPKVRFAKKCNLWNTGNLALRTRELKLIGITDQTVLENLKHRSYTELGSETRFSMESRICKQL